MARPATSDELNLLRYDRQASELYLAIRKPTVIYTAELTTPLPTTTDMVAQIYFTNGAGSLASIKVGMTIYVGTTAGSRDLGISRVRKLPDGLRFFIGEGSEINWLAEGTIYLTIVDEFGLWAKHIHIAPDLSPQMDYDIPYSDQHLNFDPTPLLGPDVVLWLEEETVDFHWPDISTASYVVDGSGITSYLWSAPGASATSNLNTASPTLTYDAPGQYKVYCTITASNGKSFIASRTVFVFSAASMPETNFTVTSNPRGDYDSGGWQFEIELYANADLSANIQDRTEIILFAKDYYSSSQVSIGPYPGRENIICTGWIVGESIQWNPEDNSVTFRVAGPQEWFKKMSGFPVGLENVGGTPNTWTSMKNLTVRLLIWHFLHWRTTATAIMDINLTTDARLMGSIDNQQTSLWAQMIAGAHDTILANPVCDRYGMFFCQVNLQFTPVTDRSTFPVVMQIEPIDWEEVIQIDRRTVADVGRVELSGVYVARGMEPQSFFSLAPGHVPKRHGLPINQDYLLLSSQAQANSLAGMILAYNNRPLDFEINLAENNRLIDIAPRQYLAIDIKSWDTLRAIAYSGNIVPRTVELTFEDNGSINLRVTGEQETFPDLAVNGDVPPGAEPLPPLPPLPALPELPDLPLGLITPPINQKNAIVVLNSYGVYYTKDLDADSPHWFAMNTGLPNAVSIQDLKVTRTGHLYLWHLTDNSIYYAGKVGDPWTKVFTADWTTVDNPESGAYPRDYAIDALGVVPDEDDTALVLASGVYSIFTSRIVYPFFGGGGGFIRSSNIHIGDPIGPGVTLGDLEYMAGGVWIWTYSDPGSLLMRAATLARNGTGISNVSVLTGIGNDGFLLTHGPHPANCAVIKGQPTDHPLLTQNDGVAWNPLTIPLAPYNEGSSYPPFRSIAINRVGDKILLGVSNTLGLRRSSDYGATWASTAVAGSMTAIYYMGDDGGDPPIEGWICAKVGDLGVTYDFGDTFKDVTGDLISWAPTFHCRIIRTW